MFDRARSGATASQGGQRRRRAAALLTLVLALGGLTTVASSAGSPEPAAAAPTGCGYANDTANNGRFAKTICWFDFLGFNETQARSSSGQAMQITLDGGYVVNFTARLTDLNGFTQLGVDPRTTPIESRFAFGSDAYRGVPGSNALYSFARGAGTTAGKIWLEDIEVVDSAGVAVSGFSFVAADAEDNVSGESFTWTSDKPLHEIERLAPNGGWGCKSPVGLGTTTVSCSGTGLGGTTTAGGKSTALLVAAESPTVFTTQWTTGARSAIAIGIQTARVAVVKQVAARIDAADSFTVRLTNSSGAVAGQGTTGSAATGTTGAVHVPSGDSYTVSEAPAGGSPTVLANYDSSWACVNAASGSSTVLPSGAGTSKTLAPAPGDDITCTVTNTAKTTGIALEKHAAGPVDVNGNGITDAGDTIAYTFTVTNTGLTGLEGVLVSDPKVGSVTCPPVVLAPTDELSCAADAPYVVDADDVAAGSVDNAATATAHPLGSTAVVTSEVATTSTPTVTPAPALTLIKSASPSGTAAFRAGQPIAYSFVVKNTGNVPLEDVEVAEADFSGTGELSPITCPPGFGSLAPGEQAICTATYTLTLDDVNAGSVSNAATATGNPVGGGGPVESPESEAGVPVSAAPAVSLLKRATPATASAEGEVIRYEFDVTNTGNVTLSGISIAETTFTGTGTHPVPVCPAGSFVPGQTVTCAADYVLTQADVDAGSVTNTATASADAGAGADPVSPPSTAVVTIPAAPALTLVKSASPSGESALRAGETITYSYVVTNTGNVTLSEVVVDEVAFTGSGTLPAPSCESGAASLAPGTQVVCTTQYTITQEDVDSGSVTNAATASADPPGTTAPPVSPPSEVTVPQVAAPGLSLLKTTSTEAITHAGQIVAYAFRVTNTGNTTLDDVAVAEGAFSGAGSISKPACPAGPLLPGQFAVCEAQYSVRLADLDGEPLTNTATATAIDPDGASVQSDASSAVIDDVVVVRTEVTALTGADLLWAPLAGALGLVFIGGLLLSRRFVRD